MGSYNREKEIVNRPCACCGADADDLHLSMRFADYPGRFDYRRCTSCGLIFNSPRLKDLGQLYDSEYFYFWKSPSFMRSRVVQQFSRLIRPVESELNGRRILEVGSARGHFLSVLKKTGFDAYGIELSEEAAQVCQRDFGISVHVGTIEEYGTNSERQSFDLVVSSCVLEHVGDPASFLRGCGNALDPGGMVVMDVPNADSANMPLLGRAWPYFQIFHVYLFNPTSARKLFERCGFEIVRIFSYNNSPTPEKACRSQKRKRLALLALDRAGVYKPLRKIYRGKPPTEAETLAAIQSLTTQDIRGYGAYQETADAKAPLAQGNRGDHIVIIAKKKVSG